MKVTENGFRRVHRLVTWRTDRCCWLTIAMRTMNCYEYAMILKADMKLFVLVWWFKINFYAVAFCEMLTLRFLGELGARVGEGCGQPHAEPSLSCLIIKLVCWSRLSDGYDANFVMRYLIGWYRIPLASLAWKILVIQNIIIMWCTVNSRL